ncbi:MAG TPA: ATP-binding protein [Longimicrobiaceae bacterium]|nr:ATP-binding protein [Longimicrobiaceae bacterium]
MRAVHSIRVRAALLICGLVLVIITAYAAAAYQQVKRSALATAGGRMVAVSRQLASVLEASTRELETRTRALAALPAVTTYLPLGPPEARAAALAAIRKANDAPNVAATELRDPSGRLVLSAREEARRGIQRFDPDLPRLAPGPGSAGIGPIRASGDTLFFPVIARVGRGDRAVGYVVRWVRMQIAGVIGPGVRLEFVNAGGQVWTSRGERVAAPPGLPGALKGVAHYERPDGKAVLAAAAPVTGTPWTVYIEFPTANALTGPRGMVRGLALFGFALLLAGAAIAWLLSGRLTGAVVELADTAEAIRRGDYARRTAVRRADEVGTLGRAFNHMAESVDNAHRQLERRVEELAASEAQNRETREQLERVVSSSRAILYRHPAGDGDVRLEWVGESVKRLLGYEVEEALAPGWVRSHVHPEDLPVLDGARERLLAADDATAEVRFRTAGGEYRWIRDEQRLVRDEQGNAQEVVGVVIDVTEHRRLTLAKEAAEAASQAKSDFLSRMSHELRTPLNAVIGFGQILELDVQTDENRESVEQILRAGRHLLTLINEVLDIARIEAGQMSLSVESVSVREVLHDALDLVRLSAAKQSISLRTADALATVAYVRADQQRLKQVLLNLLSNAIKYNRREGTITVSCEPRGDERLRIAVRDTGFGISPEYMERLFTPFERLGADQAVEGTGLGLALSRGLVEAMGGTLGVESVEGEGSCFWVELPLAPIPELSGTAAQEEAVERTAPASRATRTVLFVEDNLANVRLMERVFQRRPWVRLLTAMQGRMGLELAREHRPHLILLDRNLPDVSGDEVLRQLQQDPALRDVPVVMISGDAIPSQVQRLLDLGAHAYLTKPFDVTALLRMVDETLHAAVPDPDSG